MNHGFAAALLGFIFVNLTNYDPSKASVALTSVVMIAAVAGLVICLYVWFMLSESGKHIQGNWERADRSRANVPELEALIRGKGGGTSKLQIWNQLRIIVVLFALAFVLVLSAMIWAA